VANSGADGTANTGGGGGGIIQGSTQIQAGAIYDIVVGAGSTNISPGRGGDSYARSRQDNSYIGGTVAYGGGNGGFNTYPPYYIAGQSEGSNGGSGGGGGADGRTFVGCPPGVGVYPGSTFVNAPRQGYDGVGGYYYVSGCGGGAADSRRGGDIQGIYGWHWGGNGITAPSNFAIGDLLFESRIYSTGSPNNTRGINTGSGGGDSGVVMLRIIKNHIQISGTYDLFTQTSNHKIYIFKSTGLVQF